MVRLLTRFLDVTKLNKSYFMSLLGFLAWNVLEDVAEDIEREEREKSASYETDKYSYDRDSEESSDSDNDY